MDTASLRPASLAEVLMLRLLNDAARSSTMTASTVGTARLRIGNTDRSFDNADTFIFNRYSEGENAPRQSAFTDGVIAEIFKPPPIQLAPRQLRMRGEAFLFAGRPHPPGQV